MTAASQNPVSLSRTLSTLQRDYPAWRFAVTYRDDGPHVEAVRQQQPSTGLVCVITADTAELRSELDDA